MEVKILMIDDDEEQCRQAMELLDGESVQDKKLILKTLTDFSEATEYLKKEKFDILILDTKGPYEIEEGISLGNSILNEIKKICFIPVIFYTGFPGSVQSHASDIIRIVNKPDSIQKVKEEIESILSSKLLLIGKSINSYIEETLKSYMWDFVHENWNNISESIEGEVLEYLLAKRLAHTLSEEKIAGLLKTAIVHRADVSHPLEFYIYPPLNKDSYQTGDILSKEDDFYVLLTPSCDMITREDGSRKAEEIVLAKCVLLSQTNEFKEFKESPDNRQKRENLKRLIESRRGDRYFFLPKTWFIEDFVIDLQKIRILKFEDLASYQKICEIDNSYADSIVSKFIRYYSRIGVKDIDSEAILERIKNSAPSE